MKVFDQAVGPNGARLCAYLQQGSEEMPTASVRPAVLVLPGGGYVMCSDREAEPIALAYLAEGFNAFVLRYSVGPEATFAQALEDGEAALGCIRRNAEPFHIDPGKVAAAGFSAGGHLAASLGTVGATRPDALVLGYAVTRENMGPPMGKQPIADACGHVDEKTPPSFLFATQGDSVVPVENSLRFAHALGESHVPFELHVFLTGDHGLSLAKPFTAGGRASLVDEDAAQWLPMSVRFLYRLWGDFAVAGERDAVVSAAARARCGVDMPFSALFQNEACARAVEEILPGIRRMVAGNGLLVGCTLRKLVGGAPWQYPEGTIARLQAELERFNG